MGMTADRISRTRIIEGVAVPAFIQNGGTHYFVNLQVFADGLVDGERQPARAPSDDDDVAVQAAFFGVFL